MQLNELNKLAIVPVLIPRSFATWAIGSQVSLRGHIPPNCIYRLTST